VLSHDLSSPEDLPNFFRSAVDGYAIKAKDSFGASESLPALFELVGEVTMGRAPTLFVEDGHAVKISTGGMMPEGADGVEMVEYCHSLDETTIEVNRAISPLENVIQQGDDVRQGSTVLQEGHRLRPQDLGLMAALGIAKAKVYRKPVVAIVSTGDEIVPVEKEVEPGLVRDVNRYTLGAFCRTLGADAVYLGLCPDDPDRLQEIVRRGLRTADTVWISGGSSVGTKDLTLKVFESLEDFELLAHGISMSPGKPTIIGRSGSRPVIGLPGHVASALVVAQIFLAPLIHRLAGQRDPMKGTHTLVEARLTRNVESVSGREDYVRVKLRREGNTWLAEPIFGKSGLISTLVIADGLLRVERNREGVYQDERVEIMIFSANGGSPL
jgi:molybdopterin molybdotransferase